MEPRGKHHLAKADCFLKLLTIFLAPHYVLQVKGEKPPAPTLGLAPKGEDDEEGGEDVGDGGGGGEASSAPAVNLADLIPRNDIRYFFILKFIGFSFYVKHIFSPEVSNLT